MQKKKTPSSNAPPTAEPNTIAAIVPEASEFLLAVDEGGTGYSTV
jgi:hypothetical protein